MPHHQVRIKDLADKLRAKRGDRSLRDVAKEIDVSFSTLNRVEQGRVPDLDTFAKICSWLQVSPSTFMIDQTKADSAEDAQEKVYAHLRADRTLPTETSESLIKMIKHVYLSMGDSSLGKPTKKASKSVH
jgi:transcriptional regulator with XRE-family HTH domain